MSKLFIVEGFRDGTIECRAERRSDGAKRCLTEYLARTNRTWLVPCIRENRDRTIAVAVCDQSEWVCWMNSGAKPTEDQKEVCE